MCVCTHPHSATIRSGGVPETAPCSAETACAPSLTSASTSNHTGSTSNSRTINTHTPAARERPIRLASSRNTAGR
jgi:hypothetical protein